MKVVLNSKEDGWFSLSDEAVALYKKLNPHLDFNKLYPQYGIDNDYVVQSYTSENRSDPSLVQVVEQLKEKANSSHSYLVIVEIPDDVKWYVPDNGEGAEEIHEEHRIWSC